MKTIIECVFGNICPDGAETTESAEKFGCHACEYIHGNVVHRCCKFICVVGRMPDGEQVDEWRCSEAWIPFLLVENSMTNRGQTEALCSMRDETIKRHDTFNDIMLSATKTKLIR